MTRFAAVIGVFALVVFPLVTHAHSWGTSHEAEDNGYSIDIGYSAPAPEAGESVIFDFEMLKSGERYRDFTDVWVRIESEHGTVLATGIHNADFGGARLSYVFPEPGDYTVSARYQRSDDAVASTKFPISVIGEVRTQPSGTGGFGSSNLISVAAGLLLGFVITSLIRGKR